MNTRNETELSPIQQRIRGLDARRKHLKKLGMRATYAQLAERLDWSTSTTQRFFAGETVRVSADDERAVEALIGELEREAVDRFGKAVLAPKPSEEGGAQVIDFRPAPATGARVPVYGAVAGADGVRLSHDSVIDTVAAEDLFDGAASRSPFLMEVRSTDMEPRYFAGERALVARDKPPKPGQDCIVELKDGTAILKTYRRWASGRLWIDQYGEIEAGDTSYPADQVKALHAVIGSIH